MKADGSGNEWVMPLNDLIDIGVFTGKKDERETALPEEREADAAEFRRLKWQSSHAKPRRGRSFHVSSQHDNWGMDTQ